MSFVEYYFYTVTIGLSKRRRKMDTNKLFNGKANLYEQNRPGYPKLFFHDLFRSLLRNKVNPIIADIGAGTGIFTEVLAEWGKQAIAVEPNDEMREVLKNKLISFEQVKVVKGTAEATGLSSQSIDLITVAQAFHWFNAEAFKKECQRVLKEDGHVMLLWNSRDPFSPLNKETEEICKSFCPKFQGFSGGKKRNLSAFYEGSYERYSFSNPLKMNLQQFVGRNLSASYAPKEGEEYYNKFYQALIDLFNKHKKHQHIIVPNDIHVYIGVVREGI